MPKPDQSDQSDQSDKMEGGIDGKRMMDARKARKIKQKDLSKILGTTYSHISVIESGKIDTHVKTAKKIARALGVSMDYLCGMNDIIDGKSEIYHIYNGLNKEKKVLLLKIARVMASGGKE